MRTFLLISAIVCLGLLVGCQGQKLEYPELNPPSESALVGVYQIVEETVSGQPLEKSTLETARLELRAASNARFVDFPLFDHRAGAQGIPRKTTRDGHWLISPGDPGYRVLLDPDHETRITAVIVEGGDLIIYYAPRTDGYFTKWRKTR